jgi:hypothetical protein
LQITQKPLMTTHQPGIVGHPVIPAFERLRQEDGELEASLGYIVRS